MDKQENSINSYNHGINLFERKSLVITGVKKIENFDSEQFWNWARQKSKEGYKVYICEYDAPSDFECIWQKDKRDGMGTTITGRRQSVKVEKMFKYKG